MQNELVLRVKIISFALSVVRQHEMGKAEAVGNVDVGVESVELPCFGHEISLEAYAHDGLLVELSNDLQVVLRPSVRGVDEGCKQSG